MTHSSGGGTTQAHTTELENNRFRVPIHFATNRFTFEKNSPPPPLLHPIIPQEEARHTHTTELEELNALHETAMTNARAAAGIRKCRITHMNECLLYVTFFLALIFARGMPAMMDACAAAGGSVRDCLVTL